MIGILNLGCFVVRGDIKRLEWIRCVMRSEVGLRWYRVKVIDWNGGFIMLWRENVMKEREEKVRFG